MPLLNIHTNITLSDPKGFALQASAHIAQLLGKPESYVMVRIADQQNLVFAGTDAPCAYLELKSLGLPESQTSAFSSSLCDFLQSRLKIEADRIYIEFASPERHMWGWNSATF